MNATRAFATALFAAALSATALGTSCGGGPSGTAHSTIQGNVSDVEQARRVPEERSSTWLARAWRSVVLSPEAWAQSHLEGIRVVLEGTPFETFTDSSGSFVIESPFSGPGTLLFERANDALSARLDIDIDVPEGGTVTLRDVRCGRSSGSCRARAIDVEEPSPSVPEPSPSSPGGPSEDEPSLPSPDDPSPRRPGPRQPTLPEPSPADPSLPDPSPSEPSQPSDDDDD